MMASPKPTMSSVSTAGKHLHEHEPTDPARHRCAHRREALGRPLPPGIRGAPPRPSGWRARMPSPRAARAGRPPAATVGLTAPGRVGPRRSVGHSGVHDETPSLEGRDADPRPPPAPEPPAASSEPERARPASRDTAQPSARSRWVPEPSPWCRGMRSSTRIATPLGSGRSSARPSMIRDTSATPSPFDLVPRRAPGLDEVAGSLHRRRRWSRTAARILRSGR